MQLCLEGYYDNNIFFRIDKGFMAQAGDPTGTGRGGESVYGHSFNDEFHSRLNLSHRSVLSISKSASHTVQDHCASDSQETVEACCQQQGKATFLS